MGRLYFTVFRIDSHEQVGDRLKVIGHFARTGIQEYSDGMGGTVREYRAPGEVFSDASLASWHGAHVTVRHPSAGMVTADNWSDLAGQGVVVGHLGDDAHRADDSTHAETTIWISDADAQRQVRSGELTELSGGYTASLLEAPGVDPTTRESFDAAQTNIRGNHVAMLGAGEARGGPSVRILDSENRCIFDGNDGDRRPEENRMKVKIRVDGLDYEVEVADGSNLATAWDRQEKAHAEAVKTLTDERDAAVKKADKAEGERDAAQETLAKHPAILAAAEEEGKALLADAKKVAGKDVTGENPEAIRKAALEAAGVKVDGKSDDYIEARFDALVEAKPAKSAAENLRPGITTDGAPVKLDADDVALTSMGGR